MEAAITPHTSSSGGSAEENGSAQIRAYSRAKTHYFVFIGIMISVTVIVIIVCVSSNTDQSDALPDKLGKARCPVTTFACPRDGQCINRTLVCDGIKDCQSGADEGLVCDRDKMGLLSDIFNKRLNTNKKKDSMNNCALPAVPAECVCGDKSGIYCDNKGLLRIPQPLPKRTTILQLSGNNITSISGESIGSLPSLETFVVIRSNVQRIQPLSFELCPNLRKVHFTSNRIGHFSSSMFAKRNRITYLNLMGNEIQQLKRGDFQHMDSLQKLDLQENKIYLIEKGVFKDTPSLLRLDLRGNHITEITTDLLTGLGQLTSLYLMDNAITDIAPGSFATLGRLKFMMLGENKIKTLKGGCFDGLGNLTTLDLRENQMKTIESTAFRPLVSARSVDLRSNRITRVSNGTFSYMKQLNYIYFDKFYLCLHAQHAKQCLPKGDGISSKENLLESVVLRICVWVVALLSIGGNIVVILGRFLLREDNQIHSFFIKNLSMADLLMGLYLLVIAVYDIRFRGQYILYDKSWRNSWECDFSGVLSTLSTEMSVLTLSVITLDRYISIMYPLSFRKRGLRVAYCVMAFTWTVCIILATLPVMGLNYFGSSFYRDNAVCLPLHLHEPNARGWEYSSFLFLGINFSSFGFIAYAYVAMFYSIHMSSLPLRTSRESKERCLVQRFFFIVLTDFLCWVPIIITKILALSGVGIPVDLYAWVIVFILPVNSALNPLLYTLTTKLFKKKLFSKFSSVVFRPAVRSAKDSTHSRSSIKNNTLYSRQMQDLELDILRQYGTPIDSCTGTTSLTTDSHTVTNGVPLLCQNSNHSHPAMRIVSSYPTPGKPSSRSV